MAADTATTLAPHEEAIVAAVEKSVRAFFGDSLNDVHSTLIIHRGKFRSLADGQTYLATIVCEHRSGWTWDWRELDDVDPNELECGEGYAEAEPITSMELGVSWHGWR